MRWRRNTVAARRAIPRAHPDYGDAGIYREGHRASSKATPRRDATSVPRSSERPICRCRGQFGPESDGAAPTSTRSHKASGHPGLAGDGPAMPSAQRLTNEHLRVRRANWRLLAAESTSRQTMSEATATDAASEFKDPTRARPLCFHWRAVHDGWITDGLKFPIPYV
jgi:hypothetical protein